MATRSFAVVCIVIAALYFADLSLAHLEKREVSAESGALYHQGEALLKQNKPLEAIEPLRRAHSLDRLDLNYQLKLAEAQIASGSWPDARITLNELLARDSNDARANLLAARLSSAEKRVTDADSYYHRAIYGKWPQGEQISGPRNTRLELADLLALRGAKASLLSEVLLLQREPAADAALARRIPDLLMQAGAYPQAQAAYQALMRENPRDVQLQVGLGTVELAIGNYREARQAFTRAYHLEPGNQTVASQLKLIDAITSLDPTPRQLSYREKYDRSLDILHSITETANRCFANEQPTGDIPFLLSETTRISGGTVRGTPSNEMSEALLNLSERLWRGIPFHCREQSGQALAIVMRRVAQ